MQKAIDFNYVMIVFVTKNDYKILFWLMSNKEAIYLSKNSDLTEKSKNYNT